MRSRLIHQLPTAQDRVSLLGIPMKRAVRNDVLYLCFFIVLISALGINVKDREKPHVTPVQAQVVSPVPVEAFLKITPTVTPTMTPIPSPVTPRDPQYEEIKAYIYEVFGSHADKAMLVLSCENPSLDPRATNTAGNFPPGSVDAGIFQVNNYWQKVENLEFLFDYKVNIHIAWNIYSRDGYSFKLWTCGRKFGV